jgi:hypothetical protein
MLRNKVNLDDHQQKQPSLNPKLVGIGFMDPFAPFLTTCTKSANKMYIDKMQN